ncbi:MAG: dehydratase [Chloroflexi bacterium]|nr:dehydratase [Chloroflexota bacterium]
MAPFWEDVEVGMEIPSLVKKPSSKELVMWAGASGDFYQIHYDKDFATGTGLSGIIVHGALKNSYLGQLVTDWIGPEGTLRKLSVSYRAMDYPNDNLTCKGKVTRKEVQRGQHLVECNLWLENGKGEKTTVGSATVALSSRHPRRSPRRRAATKA